MSISLTSLCAEKTRERTVSDEVFAETRVTANTAPPPASFYQLNLAMQEAATTAISRGERLLEVEVSKKAKHSS